MLSRNNKARAPAKAHRGGTLLGIFIGLVLGALIALAVALYINKAPVPFLDKVGRNGEATTARPGADGQPAALPGKPGDKPLEKPRFDFYKILPGDEAAKAPPPAGPVTAPAGPSAPPVAAVGPPAAVAAPAAEPMFLQAGAFQDPADADNLKARLALIGIEASVQQIIMADKGTLHRVRIGPFAKPDDIARVRSQLAQNGIQANIVKAAANN